MKNLNFMVNIDYMKKFILTILLNSIIAQAYSSPISVSLNGISAEGLSYSNSTSNLYIGVEHKQSLINNWVTFL